MSDSAHKIWVKVNGEKFLVEVEDLDKNPVVAVVEGRRFEIELESEVPAGPEKNIVQSDKEIYSAPTGTVTDVTAPMPGDIIQILVQPGQVVQPGTPLCVLDAMKMKNTIHAPQGGTITEVFVQEGQSVEYGVRLFKLS